MDSSAGEGNPAEIRCCNSGSRKAAGVAAAGCRQVSAADVLRGMNGIIVVIAGAFNALSAAQYKIRIRGMTIRICADVLA